MKTENRTDADEGGLSNGESTPYTLEDSFPESNLVKDIVGWDGQRIQQSQVA